MKTDNRRFLILEALELEEKSTAQLIESTHLGRHSILTIGGNLETAGYVNSRSVVGYFNRATAHFEITPNGIEHLAKLRAEVAIAEAKEKDNPKRYASIKQLCNDGVYNQWLDELKAKARGSYAH